MDLSFIKDYIVSFLVRWVLKIGGGFLLAHGISQGSTTEVVTAIASALIGIVISLVNHNSAINTPPPKPAQ